MPVQDHVDNYDQSVVITKLALIGAYLLLVFLDLTAIFNIWVGLLYLLIFAGVIYGFFARVACPSCYYYGKMCTTATGLVAARFYKKGKLTDFEDNYQKGIMAVLIVYALPLVLAIVGFFTTESLFFHFLLLALMVVMLGIIFVIHRQQACPKCYNKDFCPAGPGAGNIDIA